MAKHAGLLRIGVGAGFADDRIKPAVDLAEQGELDYLVFECLAERTIARENLTRSKNPEAGYTPRLIERLSSTLPPCLERGIRVVTNMGAANPASAARAIRKFTKEKGLGEIPVAVVQGDDITELVRSRPDLPLMESGEPVETLLPRMVSANAYLGADLIVRALGYGTPIVVTGRVGDPSLFLAPIMHHYGWAYDDWARLGLGSICGHLLECSAMVCGGYFADPGKKEVPDLERLGHPYADVAADGSFVVTKLESAGGRVDVATCSEQLLYEIHDPANYITPDCVVDLTGAELRNLGPNRVSVRGIRSKPRTPSFKVTVGYHDGFIGEGQVSYAGINAVGRARLAAELVKARLKERGFTYSETRVDLIGMTSMHGDDGNRPEPYEVRLRIACRTTDRKAAEAVGFETRALHVTGPAGGGGGSDPVVREVLAVQSLLIPRELVKPEVYVEGAA